MSLFTPPTSPIAIAGITIRQDPEGRFCLNDLHRAAGGDKKDQPTNFFSKKETGDFVNALLESQECPAYPYAVINGGNLRGTYVVKELVYAYAMWISAKFNLQVIRAYDQLVSCQSLHSTVSSLRLGR